MYHRGSEEMTGMCSVLRARDHLNQSELDTPVAAQRD